MKQVPLPTVLVTNRRAFQQTADQREANAFTLATIAEIDLVERRQLGNGRTPGLVLLTSR